MLGSPLFDRIFTSLLSALRLIREVTYTASGKKSWTFNSQCELFSGSEDARKVKVTCFVSTFLQNFMT